MVADRPRSDRAVRHRKPPVNVRRVDDQLRRRRPARVRVYTCTCRRPTVHRTSPARTRGSVWNGLFLVNDVQPPRKLRRLLPRRLRACPRRRPGEFRAALTTTRQKQSLSTLDHRPPRGPRRAAPPCPFVADDHGVGHDRTEPMEKVEHLRPADAGKQVLVAARETDDLVREHRADNDESDRSRTRRRLMLHLHVEREQPARESLLDFRRPGSTPTAT